MSRSLGLFVLMVLGAAMIQAAPMRVGPVEAELLAEYDSVQPGRPLSVAVRLRMDEQWHTYWRNPGDAGQPTTIRWTLPEGFTAGDIQWPMPARIETGPLVSYGYEGDVLLIVSITPPANLPAGTPVTLGAHVEWLACHEECVPGEATLALTLPVNVKVPAPNASLASAFAATRAGHPAVVDWPASFSLMDDAIVLSVEVPAGQPVDPTKVQFYPGTTATIASAARQTAALENGRLILRVAQAEDFEQPPAALAGVLVSENGFGLPLAQRAVAITAPAAPTTASISLWGFMLPAFIGGLILNLMPCVFPVLGIKILGFVNQAGADRRKVALHGLTFAAGVLLSFWTLAGALIVLRAGGEQLGWGFQLQSPVFVFGLAVFLLAFALNLSGVFEFGLSATSVGGSLQMRSGYSGSFFTGVLATVVSTPCAAPFLAPALGAALALPALPSLALFTVIALGLSAPYLFLSAFPRFVKLLPRPGAWMETFKQLMAFPLYATVGFLVWVLAGQIENEDVFLKVLGAFVLVALALWGYGRWAQHGTGRRGRAFGYGFAMVVFAGGLALGYPRNVGSPWQEWRPGVAERLRAEGKVVYVDFTARWCATCKVNKLAVFSSPEIEEAFMRHGVVRLKADWTNRDPEITRALAAFGRSAVPFNLVYAPSLAEPMVLPEVLTPGVVLDALRRAALPHVAHAE